MSSFDNYNHINNLNKIKENKTTYKEIIDKQGYFIATPVGTSMLPLIRQRVDTVRLEKVQGRLKKYDVIMYQRKDGTYVLHRIVKVKKDSYVLCGDNQGILEYGITDDMIIGVMTALYRGEKCITVDNPQYIKYYKKRLRTRIFRCIRYHLSKIKRKIFK